MLLNIQRTDIWYTGTWTHVIANCTHFMQ